MVPDVRIEARLPQTLRIDAVGKDIAWMDGNRAPERDDSEDAVPDVVDRWARAARVGLLGGSFAPPEACGAVVQSRIFDAGTQRQQWIVSVERVDWGALRVLINLLTARQLDGVTIRTVPGDAGPPAREVDVASLAYPTLDDASLPFAVSRAELVSARKARAVKIAFASAPADPVVDGAVDALDLWAELVVWGGYAARGTDPRRSGGLPDGALLYDEVSVAQSFMEAFVCDEAAFEAVLSYGIVLHRTVAGVAEVRIQ
jgi:hypothetical protein